MAGHAPGHWEFLVVSLPLTNSPGWGLGGYRHRRRFPNCCENPLGEGNRNLLRPDLTHLEGGSFYTFQQFDNIFRHIRD